jgi:RNA:NAD 2'-phosphotransferase (TPT1/KptA family)
VNGRNANCSTKKTNCRFLANKAIQLRGNDYKKLSKTIAHALRHDPVFYDLILDEEGWTDLRALADALRKKYTRWENIDIKDIVEMNRLSFKKRFEIKEDKIRALYGHSSDVQRKKCGTDLNRRIAGYGQAICSFIGR